MVRTKSQAKRKGRESDSDEEHDVQEALDSIGDFVSGLDENLPGTETQDFVAPVRKKRSVSSRSEPVRTSAPRPASRSGQVGTSAGPSMEVTRYRTPRCLQLSATRGVISFGELMMKTRDEVIGKVDLKELNKIEHHWN